MAYPSPPRAFYGVHSFTPYSRTDATFYGEVKVLKSSSLSLSAALVNLMGGSSKYPWAIEEGEIKAEMSLKFGQYDDFLFQLFLGKAPSALTAETSGNVSTLTNFNGTSLMSATTGIATATALSGSEANLKFAKFVVVAVSTTTVDVYASSDADFGRGSNGSYTTDSLKIAAAQTITASTATNFTAYGFKLTGGSGTIGMTVGDSATFYTRPVSSAGGMTVVVGGLADQTFPEFGAIVMGQKRGNQEMVEIDVYRCKAAGMPISFEQNAWAQGEVKIQIMYDPNLDGIMQIRHVKPSGS
jgi:hypothetical protein